MRVPHVTNPVAIRILLYRVEPAAHRPRTQQLHEPDKDSWCGIETQLTSPARYHDKRQSHAERTRFRDSCRSRRAAHPRCRPRRRRLHSHCLSARTRHQTRRCRRSPDRCCAHRRSCLRAAGESMQPHRDGASSRVRGSPQSSPTPSRSVSSCPGFADKRQLSLHAWRGGATCQ